MNKKSTHYDIYNENYNSKKSLKSINKSNSDLYLTAPDFNSISSYTPEYEITLSYINKNKPKRNIKNDIIIYHNKKPISNSPLFNYNICDDEDNNNNNNYTQHICSVKLRKKWDIPSEPLSIAFTLAEYVDTIEFQALQRGCDPDLVFKSNYSELYFFKYIL